MAASKKSEQAVLSRRLRPIYDAIDVGHNKKAVQEAEKVLKKHPGTHAAKALKALAHIRLERGVEAGPLIHSLEDEVRKGNFDENLLQAICHCYKESYAPERIVTLFEEVVRQFPNDEQHLSQLFMAYVRVKNYKQQQKISMQLYKEFDTVPYRMWSVMSVVMKAQGDPQLGPAMLFPLAEKTLKKIAETHTFQAEEADLYLIVLEARGKLQEAIDFLLNECFSNGLATMPGSRLNQQLDRLYRLSSQHDLIVSKAMEVLNEDSDDWTAWTNLFDSGMEVIENGNAEDSENMAERLVGFCLKAQPEDSAMRGPLMARLELLERLRTVKDSKQELKNRLGNPLETLKELLTAFNTRQHCFADMKPYLSLLTKESDRRSLLKLAESRWTDGSKEVAWPDILRERLEISLALDHGRTSGEIDEKIKHLWKRTTDLIPTEPIDPKARSSSQESSAYALLLVHHLWTAHQTGTGDDNIFKMIYALESITQAYADASAHVILLLCRLSYAGAVTVWKYAITALSVGNTSRVHELCRRLDVKYIQRDSLGYLQFGLAERYGLFKPATVYYTSMSAFFDQEEREIAECTVNAYKNGQFSQIPKLAELSSRCASSIFSVGADVMNRSLSSCFAIESLDLAVETLMGESDPIDWSSICDNRDFAISSSLSLGISKNELEELQRESFNQTVSYIRLRHQLCRAIGSIGQDPSLFKIELAELRGRLGISMGLMDESQLHKNMECLGGVTLSGLMPVGNFHLPITVLTFAEQTLSQAQSNGSANGLAPIDQIKDLLKSSPAKNPQSFAERLRTSASLLESVSLALIALRLLERAYTPTTTSSSKGKSKSVGQDKKLAEYHTVLGSALKDLRKELHTMAIQLTDDCTWLVPELNFGMESVERMVDISMRKSHSCSVDEQMKALEWVEKNWLKSPLGPVQQKLKELSVSTAQKN